MGQTLASFDAVLKDDYQGPIREEINQKTNMLDLFTKDDIAKYEFVGRQVIIPLHSQRNMGVKSAAEGAPLPAAGNQAYVDLKVPLKYTYGHIQISAQVIKASRNDAGAFARALESEQKGLVNDISRARNRQLNYFGQGTLATIASGTTSATQALANPGGVTGTVNCTRFTPAGTVVAITDSTGATLRGIFTISSVSEPNVVLSASATTTTGDLVSLGTNITGSPDATFASFNAEPMGILGMADASTYVSSFQNIDRTQAANAFFKSNVTTAVGALSPDVLNRSIDNAEEISGQTINKLACHYSVRREFIKLTEADRRYNAEPGQAATFDAGNTANKKDPTYSNFPVKVDKDFAYGTLVGMNTDVLAWIPETEGEWADEDGNILLRLGTTDQYEARYRVFENFTTFQANALFRLDGISATASSGVFSF
jgi:hypothetical protein